MPGSNLTKLGVVLPVGRPDSWDSGMVESPVVWFDNIRGRYGMVYTGYGSTDDTKRGYAHVTFPSVGLAWSDDLLHWERDPRNPIFTGSGIEGTPDAAGTTGPFIWLENGTYYLFYFGTTGKGYEKGTKSLNLATSTDLVTWVRYTKNPIIAPAGTGWRRDAIWHPNIVKDDGRYYLFFNASGAVHGLVEEFIGYATSSDLYEWNVDDTNSPLVVGSGKPGAWDATGRAGDPSVFKVEGTWYMAWYSWDRKNSADGLAWTTDEEFPLNWRVYENNPVLRVG
ncbi:MAG: family 43 glycosylhydrolase, partial [Bacteroidota bacterium]